MPATLLLVRELRGRGRWQSTYIWRAAHVLLLGGLVALLAALAGPAGLIADLGREIFGPFAWVQAAALLLFTAFSAGETLFAERERGTLELLFLSGARPAGLLFSRALAAGLAGLALAAGAAPFLFTLVGLGGVSPGQAASLVGFSASLAALGAALGVLAGAAGRNRAEGCVWGAGWAIGWALVLPLLLSFCALLPVVFLGASEAGVAWFWGLSPLPALLAICEGGGRAGFSPWGWWPAALYNVLLAWFFLWRARPLLGRPLKPLGLVPRLGWRWGGVPYSGRRDDGNLPGDDPVAWREELLVRRGRLRRLALRLGWLVTLAFSPLICAPGEPREFFFTAALCLFGPALAALLIAHGAWAFAGEKGPGPGEALRGCALGAWRILWGKTLGILRGLRALLVPAALFLPAYLIARGFSLAWAAAALAGLVQLYALALFLALFARKAGAALAGALALGAGWLMLQSLCCRLPASGAAGLGWLWLGVVLPDLAAAGLLLGGAAWLLPRRLAPGAAGGEG